MSLSDILSKPDTARPTNQRNESELSEIESAAELSVSRTSGVPLDGVSTSRNSLTDDTLLERLSQGGIDGTSTQTSSSSHDKASTGQKSLLKSRGRRWNQSSLFADSDEDDDDDDEHSISLSTTRSILENSGQKSLLVDDILVDDESSATPKSLAEESAAAVVSPSSVSSTLARAAASTSDGDELSTLLDELGGSDDDLETGEWR